MNAKNHYVELSASRQRKLKKIPTSLKSIRQLGEIFLFLSMGISIALFIVWIRVQIVHVGYEISEANQLQHELFQSQEWLKIRVASLRSPQRIERIAQEKLGLKVPERQQIQWLK